MLNHQLIRRILRILAAVGSGFLLALCYPRFNIESLVWLWAGPLMAVLWFDLGKTEPKRPALRGFGLGYLAGLTFFAINVSWITEVTVIGYLVFSLYLALFIGVWGLIASTAGRPREALLCATPGHRHSLFRSSLHSLRCAFVNASAWTGLEWLRGWLMTGFGWNGLGVALHDNLNLIQIADIIGVTGLAFLPMFANTILVITIRRFHLEMRAGIMQPHLDFAFALMLIAGVFLYGLDRTLEPEPDGLDLQTVLVQLNVPQEEKWDERFETEIMNAYADYSTMFDAQNPKLIIWPESSLPHVIFAYPGDDAYFNNILAQGDFYLMLGANDKNFTTQDYFNAAVLMKGSVTKELSIYHKVHLVPFGEFVPFRNQFPFLNDWFERVIPGDFSRGTRTDPLPLDEHGFSIIPMICFEDTVGRLTRRFVRPEPQLLVNVTNDGWFGRSAAAEQHLANARFRTVELRRPMARACNTGVTCMIDTKGRITTKLIDADGSIFTEGALTDLVRIPGDPETTFYSRHGDLFTAVVAGLGLLLCIAYAMRGMLKRS